MPSARFCIFFFTHPCTYCNKKKSPIQNMDLDCNNLPVTWTASLIYPVSVTSPRSLNRSIGCCFLLQYTRSYRLRPPGMRRAYPVLIYNNTPTDHEWSRAIARSRQVLPKQAASKAVRPPAVLFEMPRWTAFGLRRIVWATGRIAWPQMPFLLTIFWPVSTAFQKL